MTPELQAVAAEEFGQMLDLIVDQRLRQIALLRLEGKTCAEIAVELGCSESNVALKLEYIREAWSAYMP